MDLAVYDLKLHKVRFIATIIGLLILAFAVGEVLGPE